MASTSSMRLLLCLISCLFILPSFSHTITLDLLPIPKTHSSHHPKDIISDIAKSSLHRAHHLKYDKHHRYPSSVAPSAPLFAHSSPGEYSVSLSLGNPPQKIPTIFDTGSVLVWVPCTSHYTCSNCTQTSSSKINIFKPKRSSSKRVVSCNNPKCEWLDEPGMTASCRSCRRCRSPCAYTQTYGSGQTLGHAITEDLHLQGEVIPDLLLGCSSSSELISEGIAGFGRSPMSLPSQLKVDKFSYCLISHKFDDTSKSSQLILGDSKVAGVKYTPLLKNPPMIPFNVYYYVHLENVQVGTKFLKMATEVHAPDSNGNGGCIVDSGSTLTSLPSTLFTPLVNEFVEQMLPGKRSMAEFAPTNIGNVLCVNVTGEPKLSFPEVVFHFKGGAKMDVPAANYFNAGANLMCLPFVNVTFAVGLGDSGPAVIVGNYQQQNYHIEYDLKNERLGLKKQNCGLSSVRKDLFS